MMEVEPDRSASSAQWHRNGKSVSKLSVMDLLRLGAFGKSRFHPVVLEAEAGSHAADNHGALIPFHSARSAACAIEMNTRFILKIG